MIKPYYKILFTLFILVFACDAFSQNLNSLSVIDSKYDSLLKSDNESMNTLFYKHKNDVHIDNLGPFGSPFYYPTAFFLEDKHLLIPENEFKNSLYNLSGFKPFTNIAYINASRKEQQFLIKHVQGFGKLLLFDFDFNKVSSPGAFVNQEANNTLFNANLKYESKKKNYLIKFSNRIERNSFQENGGLTNLDDYELNVFDDEQNYSVNLTTSNSFKKRYEYEVEQRLDLFQLSSDSIRGNQIYLKHQISYSTQQKVFYDTDPLSSIYNNVYLDSVSSIDSIYTNNFNNMGFIGFRNNNYSAELFGQYDLKRYQQSVGIDSNYHNAYIGFLGHYKNNSLLVNTMVKYGIDGYRNGDIESELLLSFDSKRYKLTSGVTYFLNEPGLKSVYYNSNHFIWLNTSFEKQSTLGLSVDFKLKEIKLDIKGSTKLLNNTLYFDSLALANQDNNITSITSFSISKEYQLLSLHFRTALIYQVTTNETLFPLPKMIGRQVVYYQKHIFKANLQFQFGVGFSYSTKYYGYAYMPAINEFYVQKNTVLGYYPRVDIFINTHLKRAQIFLKYEHVNSGRNLEKSYITPGYPSLGKSLKFGVSWNIFD